jgi:hypothetical protein
MTVVDLDATSWRSGIDFYNAIRQAVGAPPWHGSSVDAFLDSMVYHDEINELKAPYTLKIHGLFDASPDAQAAARELADAIRSHGRSDLGSDLHVELVFV